MKPAVAQRSDELHFSLRRRDRSDHPQLVTRDKPIECREPTEDAHTTDVARPQILILEESIRPITSARAVSRLVSRT